MHSPMQSLGDSRTQPSTPNSHSGECGGNRSTEGAAEATRRERFARFKSAPLAPSLATESIMRAQQQKIASHSNRSYRFQLTGCSQKISSPARKRNPGKNSTANEHE